MRWLRYIAILALSCAAHEKAGDRAAALGDWRVAFDSYREAVSNNPDSPELRAKYESARKQLVDSSLRKARACIAGADFDCAVSECQYVLSLDAGNADAASLRTEASKAVAVGHLAAAREHVKQSRPREAFSALAAARRSSKAPELQAEADEIRANLVPVAVAVAQQERASKRYNESIQLLKSVVKIDGTKSALLEEVVGEFEAFKKAEYDRLCLEGDKALAAKNWPAAAQSYRQALDWQAGERAGPLLRYAVSLERAELLFSRGDLSGAATSYREAVATGADTSRYATDRIESEHMRLSQAGEQALSARAWAKAAQSFREALEWKSDSRLAAQLPYLMNLDRGEVMTARRDYAAATAAYREASASGMDSSGFAAAQLEAVEVKPYTFRIRTLFVEPTNPAGAPWVGPRSPLFGELAKIAAGVALPAAGALVATKVVDAIEKVPPENRPQIWVEVTQPDGRRLATPHTKALYANYESSFVLMSNHFDSRLVHFRVFAQGDRVEDVGVFDVPLNAIVTAREYRGTNASVRGILLQVELAFPLEPHHQARVVRFLLEVERLDVAQVPADLHALGLGRRLPRHAEQDHEADQPHTRDSGAPGRRRQSSLKVSVQPQSPRVPTADELARAIGKLLEHRHE